MIIATNYSLRAKLIAMYHYGKRAINFLEGVIEFLDIFIKEATFNSWLQFSLFHNCLQNPTLAIHQPGVDFVAVTVQCSVIGW